MPACVRCVGRPLAPGTSRSLQPALTSPGPRVPAAARAPQRHRVHRRWPYQEHSTPAWGREPFRGTEQKSSDVGKLFPMKVQHKAPNKRFFNRHGIRKAAIFSTTAQRESEGKGLK